MSIWLQLDSGSRSNAYFFKSNNTTFQGQTGCSDGVWFPTDLRHGNTLQTPVNYKIEYKELNTHNNIKTLNFLAHCKERPENLTFNVEFCSLTVPACARVKRPADPVKGIPEKVVNIMDEPYLYIEINDNENQEGDLICTNNKKGTKATFVVYNDKLQVGTAQDGISPPGLPTDCSDDGNTYCCVVPNIKSDEESVYSYTKFRWAIYKSCMTTTMRLDLGAQQWNVRIFDRFGNDIVILEDDNDCNGFPRYVTDKCIQKPCNVMPHLNPPLSITSTTLLNCDKVVYAQPAMPPLPDPNIQTSILLGISPNFNITSSNFNYGYFRNE